MTDETEDSEELDADFDGTSYPDTLDGPDGQAHFAYDAQSFLLHWLGKLNVDATGGALLFGEGGSIHILHPETGEVLTPQEIAKRAKTSVIRRVQ